MTYRFVLIVTPIGDFFYYSNKRVCIGKKIFRFERDCFCHYLLNGPEYMAEDLCIFFVQFGLPLPYLRWNCAA